MDQSTVLRPGQPGPATPLASMTAEHDWAAAKEQVLPVLRPAGTPGHRAADLDSPRAAAGDTTPLVDDGPCGLAVVYALHASGYDVFASGDHLAAWGVSVAELRTAAMRNLAAWSAGAPWADEADGPRRIRSSATGSGSDAARILLPEVRAALAAELGGHGVRVLVGVPERHLLVAAAEAEGDDEFATMFAEFVATCAEDADEPIERRLLELVDGQLVAATRADVPKG